MNYQYLLFDLDGTLTDSAEGILNSVVYALKKRGFSVPEQAVLLKFVGPPLLDSFQRYCGLSREQAVTAVADYREYFTEKGWCENRVYEGIPEVLASLKAEGRMLIVATSKPEPFAKRIAEHFGLSQYFDRVIGSSLDGKIKEKGQVIDLALRNIGREHQTETLMIGDREHDVKGAEEHALPCLGVLYGYGSRQELMQAGAAAVCEQVRDLPDRIRQLERLG